MSVSGLVGRIIFNISKLFYQIIQMIRLCYGWRFINKNNKILEISRVTNSDPSTIGVYATVYNGNSGAFNANQMVLEDQSHKFGTTIANV
jgi:hypothetical protein